MIKEMLISYMKKCSTLLGVGPMSLNCVDSVIEISNHEKIPLILIASRRQIDSEDFGGGYVNNWSTEEFSKYVFNKDKLGLTYLARDHGGPWQSDLERKERFGLREAMESAKKSYKVDIDAGFQILHLDPSIDIHGPISVEEGLERLFELYDFCCNYAKKQGKEIIYEIGTEEQTGSTNSQEELHFTLSKIYEFCEKNKYPKPTFVVIQTGTKVKELRNIGSLDSPFRVKKEIPPEIQIPQMINICKKYQIYMKEHNADYLSDEVLSWHPRLGIHSANVAPEFGVTETKAFLKTLENNGLKNIASQFLRLSYDSRKWDKWIIKGSKTTDREKAIIAGHYNFSTPEFIEIKNKADNILDTKGINLDLNLKEAIKKSIYRYLKNFRMVL
ncbi:tagatose-6-phosphate kinase [Prochlorococcus sp. RSP50]|nr:tagatose-6-phosphate kinase [Prochlorococcus sp. RS50]AQL33144.1 tagatose-6-phosphate kinase [Prochlorococcus sp. RS01]AQL35011.1 tagatose-6-phosphate kinase [Prochlorococcus sp. RS04]